MALNSTKKPKPFEIHNIVSEKIAVSLFGVDLKSLQ